MVGSPGPLHRLPSVVASRATSRATPFGPVHQPGARPGADAGHGRAGAGPFVSECAERRAVTVGNQRSVDHSNLTWLPPGPAATTTLGFRLVRLPPRPRR